MKSVLGDDFLYCMMSLITSLKRIEVDPGGDFPISTTINVLRLGPLLKELGTITLDGNVKDYSKGETILNTSRGKTPY